MCVKIDLPFIHVDRCSKTGRLRIYFRRRLGAPKIRIRAKPGTTEFAAEYNNALAASNKPDGSIKPETFRWLLARYFAASEFKRLDERTQRTRRGILEHIADEPLTPGSEHLMADCPIKKIKAKHVRMLRDRKSHVPEGANNRVRALRKLFTWAMSEELLDDNPARDCAYIRVATTGHHSWTEEEVRQFEERHPIGTRARLALAVLLFTGTRRSDAVLLGKQHVRIVTNPETGAPEKWLKFVARKNRNRKPIMIELPLLQDLQDVIALSPTSDLAFISTDAGKPFTSGDSFGNKFRQWCREAGLPHCSPHGLRKAGAAIAAERGASTHTLMAIYGWSTMREAERYTEAARRKKLAARAPELLGRKTNKTSPTG